MSKEEKKYGTDGYSSLVSEYMKKWDAKKNKITLEQFKQIAILYDRKAILEILEEPDGQVLVRNISKKYQSMLVSPYKETEIYSGDELIATLPSLYVEVSCLNPKKVDIDRLESKFESVERNDFMRHEAPEGIRKFLLFSQDKGRIKEEIERARELTEKFPFGNPQDGEEPAVEDTEEKEENYIDPSDFLQFE